MQPWRPRERRRRGRLGAGLAVAVLVTVSALAVGGGLSSPGKSSGGASPAALSGAMLTRAAATLAPSAPAIKLYKWTLLSPRAAPSARSGFAMAYDAGAHESVLFGGTPGVLGDTWTFANGSWTNVTRSPSPPPRYDAAMTYDTADGYLLLFGGIGAHGPLNDTWKFSAGVWTNLTAGAAPAARFGAALAYDPALHAAVLFGGCAMVPPPGQALCRPTGGLNDTWTYRAGVWTPLRAGAVHPHGRYAAGLSYDPRLHELVLYGGNGQTAYLDSIWVFVGHHWRLVTKSSGLGGRGDFGAAFYRPTASLILFGGTTGEPPFQQYLGGTYTYVNGTWVGLAISGPTAREGALLVPDPAAHGDLLFGGYSGPKVGYSAQTWLLT